MADQAQGLRDLLRPPVANDKQTRIITVTSGKGGVGKSNFTLNFALTLQSEGYKVLVFDADMGMANIDVLMGVRPPYSLYHLLKREKSLREIICRGQNDLMFIAGGSGFQDLMQLDPSDLDYFTSEIEKLNGEVDFILFDTGAGLTPESLKFILAAEETIVVTTPEPTAITDAYATIKLVSRKSKTIPFKLVINRVSDDKEGKQAADKIQLVARQFLDADVSTLGYVPDDSQVMKSVKKQIPFTIAYPNSPAARRMRMLVNTYLRKRGRKETHTSGMKGFLRRMVHLLK